jgi:hypothetical protein
VRQHVGRDGLLEVIARPEFPGAPLHLHVPVAGKQDETG